MRHAIVSERIAAHFAALYQLKTASALCAIAEDKKLAPIKRYAAAFLLSEYEITTHHEARWLASWADGLVLDSTHPALRPFFRDIAETATDFLCYAA